MKQKILWASTMLMLSPWVKGEKNNLETDYELESLIVSASPEGRSVADFPLPVSIMEAEDLVGVMGSNLGEALNWETGVHQSSFSAGASRPMVRGFDGSRVQILNSGVEALDVSSTSPDHGVALEAILSERVEVIRGAGTLLYGSSAIGGVVNVIGREMPRTRIGTGADGLLAYSHDSVSSGDTLVGYTQVQVEDWAISLTGLSRRNGDYEIPGEAGVEHEEDHEDEHEEEGAHEGVLENSFVDTDVYSIGVTRFFEGKNRIGMAYSTLESSYGVPGHEHEHEEEDDHEHEHEEEGHGEVEGVSIDLERTRYEFEWELFELTEWVEALRLRFDYTDYMHVENEDGMVGTRFEREGWELRAEASHADWWVFEEGIVGLQMNDSDFRAEGEEAFTPASGTQNEAVFMNEHLELGWMRVEVGGRIELQQIEPEIVAAEYSELATSVAVSGVWPLDKEGKDFLSLSVQRSQRHPTSTELYADGPHLATSQYEVGDGTLGLETAYGVDLKISHFAENGEATLTFFQMQFDDYIFADATGDTKDGLAVYQFRNVDAVYWGIEGEWKQRLYRSIGGESEVVGTLMSDWVRAENRTDGENLPRIPPLRIGMRVEIRHGGIEWGVALRYAFEADAAPNETETAGYTELNTEMSWTVGRAESLEFFIKGSNLLDEEIRSHTSYLKDIAPQPGRNVAGGLRFRF